MRRGLLTGVPTNLSSKPIVGISLAW